MAKEKKSLFRRFIDAIKGLFGFGKKDDYAQQAIDGMEEEDEGPASITGVTQEDLDSAAVVDKAVAEAQAAEQSHAETEKSGETEEKTETETPATPEAEPGA